jgi:hypothetical protein
MKKLTQGDTLNGTIRITGKETQVIANGTDYRVKSDPNGYYRSVTYDGTVYEIHDIFTGTTVTTFTGDGEVGEVIDITGWEFYLTLRKDGSIDDTDALKIHITVPTDPTNGLTTYTFTHDETKDLELGLYHLETKWKDTGSNINTFSKEQITVEESLLDAL